MKDVKLKVLFVRLKKLFDHLIKLFDFNFIMSKFCSIANLLWINIVIFNKIFILKKHFDDFKM